MVFYENASGGNTVRYPIEEYEILYKGTNHDMSCRGLQYTMDREHVHYGDIGICYSGFHACRNPYDVSVVYPILSKNYRLFKILGHVVDEHAHGSRGFPKVVCDSIKFLEEITITDLIDVLDNKKIEDPLYRLAHNLEFRIDKMKEYKEQKTYEEKVSWFLRRIWATKYYTINQMKKFVNHIDSLDDTHLFHILSSGWSYSLNEISDLPKELRLLGRKSFTHPDSSDSYDYWYEKQSKKLNRKRKTQK